MPHSPCQEVLVTELEVGVGHGHWYIWISTLSVIN